MRIFPSKNSNIYDKYFVPLAGSAVPTGLQTPAGIQPGTNSARISNKILHKLLFSDELAAYPQKRFQRTMSKHQVLYQRAEAVVPSNDSVETTPKAKKVQKMLSSDTVVLEKKDATPSKKNDASVS